MRRVIFAAVAVLAMPPLLAWQPPKWGVKERPAPRDGQRTWSEVVAAFKDALPKCGEAMELDAKGQVCFTDMGVLDLNGTLSAEEEVTQLAVWAAMCSPMLTVGDVGAFRKATRRLLEDRGFRGVSQDFVARQAYPIYVKDDVYVLLKDCWGLNCKFKVVTFANFSDRPAELSIPLDRLEVEGPATVSDLLRVAPEKKGVTAPLIVGLMPHQTKQFRVVGAKPLMRRRYTVADSVWCRLGSDVQFRHVYAPRDADYLLKVTMKDDLPYTLQADGLSVATNVRGSGTFTARLYRNDNTVRFVGVGNRMPAVEALEVVPLP